MENKLSTIIDKAFDDSGVHANSDEQQRAMQLAIEYSNLLKSYIAPEHHQLFMNYTDVVSDYHHVVAKDTYRQGFLDSMEMRISIDLHRI
ncbi:hypothetical protein [Pelosinus sp. sgz500959]|uniref:hypothetical protein n=1 Tax=Pelosinus sp. sgz500959 TaxID=3242472 RepID=UPI00367038E0